MHNHRHNISLPHVHSNSTILNGRLKHLVEWDWDIEHQDRKSEAKADAALHGAQPFQVDRRLLKDVVREKMDSEVGRIKFLSSGTFHKAYLITLSDGRELVARVARRFMPRLKTESEVATMRYLRENTNIPVPTVYHYDANPYNRLGGEYILMSKATGIPLSKVYQSMGHDELLKLLANIAALVIPLFAHRFSHLGSLYYGPCVGSAESAGSSTAPTPRATGSHLTGFPFSPSLGMTSMSAPLDTPRPLPNANPTPRGAKAASSAASPDFHVGPIISWPFFGSNRGDLSHPAEINRGPWRSAHAYLLACAEREVAGVVRENEGKAAPHRLHLDPAEIQSSRHHHLPAVPGDQSDESDEWGLEESEEEWDGPGDAMYRDYRRMQRSTFLVAHMVRREDAVREETGRWVRLMERLGVGTEEDGNVPPGEEFGLDCHDLSLENVFVDEQDNSKVTCIIDWESTTTRPLWACAHLPAFLQSSPFTADLFRDAVAKLATGPSSPSISTNGASHPSAQKDCDLAARAREWLHFEASGARLRMAHRFAEWDGWEEGLGDSILGPEEQEEEWFRDADTGVATPPLTDSDDNGGGGAGVEPILVPSLKRRKGGAAGGRLPFAKEREKVRALDTTGDVCGGRGGELGRRLEAWLSNGSGGAGTTNGRRWEEDDDREYEAEAE